MSFIKHRKAIISLAAVAVISLGGISAFAAETGATLTPVGSLDMTEANIQKGEYKIAGKIDPRILDGFKNAKTASGLALTAVPGSIDTTNVQKGEYKIVGDIDLKTLGQNGQGNAKTAK